jgi:hypothetical protein
MRDLEWDSVHSRTRKREGELGAYGTLGQGYALSSGELALAEIGKRKPLEKNRVDSKIERAAVEMGLVLTETQVATPQKAKLDTKGDARRVRKRMPGDALALRKT